MQSCESFFLSFPLMCLSEKAALISSELYIRKKEEKQEVSTVNAAWQW